MACAKPSWYWSILTYPHYSLSQLHIKVSMYTPSRSMNKIWRNTRTMSEHSCHHSENETTQNTLLQQVIVLESEMEDMQAQIAQKQAFLLEQEQQHQQLNSQLNSLSPIDQLPAGIKTEIFYSALCPITKGGKNPFFLGKICWGCRDFVWSSPVLWMNIHLWLMKKGYKAQTNLLQDWLFRTAGCPLTFYLTAV